MREIKRILAVNCGSSSIKFALYGSGEEREELLFSGVLERIGLENGRFAVTGGSGGRLVDQAVSVTGHREACKEVFSWISQEAPVSPDAIGHRIVHGGPLHLHSEVVTQEVLDSVEAQRPYAPEHLPGALYAVRHAQRVFARCGQVLCFDTAFHHTMPPEASIYPLPDSVRSKGVRRFGFHGLSYAWLMDEIRRREVPAVAEGRIILAHLGHGASMAAVCNGRSIETSMGFSPAGGLVMSTRSGDLDPGVLLFLLEQQRMNPAELKEMVNRCSGLLGLSGRSDDMRDLLEAAPDDPAAAMAVEIFCYQARRYVGSLAAALGGLDLLVFSGGIGEHAPEIRRRICRNLEFLGIRLDEAANSRNETVISHRNASTGVRVMKTNEELMIVRETRRVLAGRQH